MTPLKQDRPLRVMLSRNQIRRLEALIHARSAVLDYLPLTTEVQSEIAALDVICDIFMAAEENEQKTKGTKTDTRPHSKYRKNGQQGVNE